MTFKSKKEIMKVGILFAVVLLVVVATASYTFGERINFADLPFFIRDRIAAIIGSIISGEKIQTYELLIKKVQTGVGEGAYQGGDIVAIKPLGHQWSSGEIQNFWIVRMDLTPSQAEELLKPKERPTGENDEAGQPIMKMEARREYYIDPEILRETEAGQKLNKNIIEKK
ncbi:hypothetical protein KKD20_04280 [Patescibacteria group bacterium]|nr:hypothetical protein [Patescibacteria group bacterium]